MIKYILISGNARAFFSGCETIGRDCFVCEGVRFFAELGTKSANGKGLQALFIFCQLKCRFHPVHRTFDGNLN